MFYEHIVKRSTENIWTEERIVISGELIIKLLSNRIIECPERLNTVIDLNTLVKVVHDVTACY